MEEGFTRMAVDQLPQVDKPMSNYKSSMKKAKAQGKLKDLDISKRHVEPEVEPIEAFVNKGWGAKDMKGG